MPMLKVSASHFVALNSASAARARSYMARKYSSKVLSFGKLFWQNEEGHDTVEFGLLMVLIALAAIAALGLLVRAARFAFGSGQESVSTS